MSHRHFSTLALALLALPLFSQSALADLVVTPVTPDASGAATLAANLAGSGVSISNATLVGVINQQGTFTGGTSVGGSNGIGIDSGVILTNGNALLAPGPNNNDYAGAATGTPGYAPLTALIPGYSTFDANVLSFDFTTNTGDLFFNYVFASEEYNEYVNSSFNDVFGFFFNGSNIALIPGTSTPVSINNVNCGYSTGGALPGSNPSNCSYFNNNDTSNGGPFYNIQYDGFTDVFTASLTGLAAGTTYHLDLAIADAGDEVLDSAVFLKAGSFSGTNPNPAPEPATLALLGLGLAGLGVMRRKV